MEEEISLRELIEILIRQKKLIAALTAVAILASSIFSFFILSPEYEAKTILMASNISNSKAQAPEANGIEGILNTMSQYPQMSIETYKEQLNNPHILEQAIAELKLNELGINRNKLKSMISLGTIKDTNLITITVKNSDPKIAAGIANTIANKFTAFVSENAKVQASKSSTYIKQQMDIEKQNLDNALVEYKEYLAQPKGLTELQKEIESKLILVTQYKTDLINSQLEESKLAASINIAEAELANTSEKIVLKKSLLDDPYMTETARSKNAGNQLSGLGLESEEINEAYIVLKQQINEMKIELASVRTQKSNTEKFIKTTQEELENLQVSLAEKQYEDNIIKQKVDFSQSTYEAFLKKYEETRIASSSNIGDSSIIIVSPALEPIVPVGPRKMLNVAIGTVLGLMTGVFIAFFREYWINTASNATTATNRTKQI